MTYLLTFAVILNTCSLVKRKIGVKSERREDEFILDITFKLLHIISPPSRDSIFLIIHYREFQPSEPRGTSFLKRLTCMCLLNRTFRWHAYRLARSRCTCKAREF